jgi:chromate transport protein ChrA
VSTTVVGIAVGAVLAIVGLEWGFGALVVVALCMAVGGLVGRVASGRTDLGGLLDALRGRRSSS